MLLLYVDDMFVIGMDRLITDTKRNLLGEFEMKDLGMMHYFQACRRGKMWMESPSNKGSMQ